MSSKAIYGYLAAMIDGEGCLSIGAGRRKKWGVINYNPIVSVANTDKRIIDWLQQHFGGNQFVAKMQTSRQKQAYVWRMLAKKDIELLLLAAMPYLISKRERAIILLEFVRLPRTADPVKRKELFDKLAVLNQRGVSVTTNTQDELPMKYCLGSPENIEHLRQQFGGSKIESGLLGDEQSVPVVTQEAATAAMPV